jgi:hypothetical protein
VNDSGTPGWYPDPHRRFEFRYYNGERWTADVSVHGQRMIDSGDALPGQASWASTQPAWGPTPHRPGRGAAVASFITAISGVVIGWIPFLFVVGAAAAVVGFFLGIVGIRAARLNDGHGRGFAVAGLVLAPIAIAVCVGGFFFTRLVLHEVDRYNNPGNHTTQFADTCSADGSSVTFTGSITNNETTTHDYQLTIEYSVNGSVVQTDNLAVKNVAAGSTKPWTALDHVEKADTGTLTCRVSAVHGPLPFGVANP